MDRLDRGLSVGSDRAVGGSERMEDKLDDEGLGWAPMEGEMAGSVARRGSWESWRALAAAGEKRAAIALRDFCVARKVSIGARMLPSELCREIAGAGICSTRGTEIIEQPIRRNP